MPGRCRACATREPGEDKISFTPGLLPRDLHKAKPVEELLPWLYLKGVCTGDLTGAPAALPDPDARGLPARTITRLKANWRQGCEAWQKRDLGAHRFPCIRAGGVYCKPRMAGEKQRVPVITGAGEYGRKKLLAMTDGLRESTQSRREVLLDLRRRGLKQGPKLATGDGARGFRTALRQVFAPTGEQRCRVDKTMNVLHALPHSVQARAKGPLHDIRQAETGAAANAAFDVFAETCGVNRDKAVAKPVRDRAVPLAFYNCPAGHWKHIRTTNPTESTSATVRQRTKRTTGCLSRQTGLAMAFRLMITAQSQCDRRAKPMAQARWPKPPARGHERA